MVNTYEILKPCMRPGRAGSVLSGGGSVPAKNAPPEAWVKMVNGMQSGAPSTRLGIPIIYGIDAVHGHGNVYKATIFPHNIGLGCTRYVRTYVCFNLFAKNKLQGKMKIKMFAEFLCETGPKTNQVCNNI